jgi:hypothetical protein
MKRLLLLLLAILFCCPLLMGAAVQPTDNFYVNDYSALLSEEEQAEMTRISGGLFADTGVRLVFLSPMDMDGIEPAAYADSIIKGWGLTASDVLFFVYQNPEGRGTSLLVGENVNGVWEGEIQKTSTNAMMKSYRAIAGYLYENHGVTPGAEIEALLDKDNANPFGPFGSGGVIVLAVLGVALARAYRSDRKLKGKYLKGYVRKRKSYTRTYNEEDEYHNEKIYKITYADQD